jgi:hypothetical protein
MQVNDRVFELAMTQQHLDGAQISASFEQVRGEAVAQGIVVLLMICTPRRFTIVIIPSLA